MFFSRHQRICTSDGSIAREGTVTEEQIAIRSTPRACTQLGKNRPPEYKKKTTERKQASKRKGRAACHTRDKGRGEG